MPPRDRVDETRDSQEQNSSDPAPTPRRITFASEPGNVRVVLQNVDTDQQYEQTTPVTFDVPPGRYTWRVSKNGYEGKSSERPLDLKDRSKELVDVTLSPSRSTENATRSEDGNRAEELSPIVQGNQAFQNGNYDRAIDLYQSVDSPESDDTSESYVRALSRLGRLYWKHRQDFEQAIQSYEALLQYDPTRYGAHRNLARIAYQLENYGEALNHLDSVNRMKYQIPVEKRTTVSLQVKHLRASVLYDQTMNATSERRKGQLGPRAYQSLLSFVESVPSELEGEFQGRIQDARRKIEKMRSLLQETN